MAILKSIDAIAEIEKRTKDEGVKKAYQLIEELMIFANESSDYATEGPAREPFIFPLAVPLSNSSA